MIERTIKKQQICFEKYLKPLYRSIYDLAKETRHNEIYQAEFGRRLGIPQTLAPDNTHKDMMIQELRNRCEESGLVTSVIIRGHRYIRPADPSKIPENAYSLNFKHRASSGEALVRKILSSFNKKIKSYWQVALSEFPRAPFDFQLTSHEDVHLGFIEYQGLQHTKRIKYFHPDASDFQNRKKIDKIKKKLALECGRFLAIHDTWDNQKKKREIHKFVKICLKDID